MISFPLNSFLFDVIVTRNDEKPKNLLVCHPCRIKFRPGYAAAILYHMVSLRTSFRVVSLIRESTFVLSRDASDGLLSLMFLCGVSAKVRCGVESIGFDKLSSCARMKPQNISWNNSKKITRLTEVWVVMQNYSSAIANKKKQLISGK